MSRTIVPAADPRQMRLAAPALAVVCLVGVVLTHALDLPDKLVEAHYMAALFGALIIASCALAAMIVLDICTELAIAVAGVLAAMTIVGYVLSRSVGLPQLEDHVGKWADPIGIVSLVCEAILVVLAACVVGWRRMAVLVAGLVAIGTATAVDRTDNAAARDHHMPAMNGMGGVADYPSFAHTSAATRSKLRSLWRATVREAARYDTLAELRGAGFAPMPLHIRRPLIVHWRQGGKAAFTGRLLDARHPQSVVLWCPAHGAPTLLAFMYRAPRRGSPPPPTDGGVLYWHHHGHGDTLMTHVWLTGSLRSAFARCLPVKALEARLSTFRYSRQRHAETPESMPCSA